MNTSMNTSEYRRSWAQACWRSWRAKREMLAELAQGEAAALTRLPLEDWLEAGAAIDTLLQHIHAPEAGVEYPDDAFLRYRVTVLVDTLAWSGPPGQDPLADTLRENLTVGAWCLAVAEYAAWMPQH